MEQKPFDTSPPLPGTLSPGAAKEYLLGLISALKLTERQAAGLDAELEKWESRVKLAESRGNSGLAREAAEEAARIKAKREGLTEEIRGLQSQIEEARRQLPQAAARERSVDPDLLEQELLIASGRLPGEEKKALNDRLLRDMEDAAAAGLALAELKAKMGKGPNPC